MRYTLLATSLLFALGMQAQASNLGVDSPQTAPRTPSRMIENQALRAQLSPRNYTTLAAEIGAKVDRVTVKEGQAFRAGQTLVTLDCSLQLAQEQRAKAELGGAEKVLAANRRLAELHSIGEVELEVSAAQVEKLRADLAYVDATLAKCTVTAPFAGRVVEQKAREQQFIQAGQPLLDILDDTTLELEFIVPSRWLAWLKTGHAFKVVIDETGQTYPARISRLGARVDPVSQSIKAAATIDGRFPDLIAGMSGHLLLTPPVGTP
jgi:RND family efflux transporter MFP subunit